MSAESEYKAPPHYAKVAGVSVEKVIGWLLAGELKGVNLASKGSKRPRYRIAESDWQAFLESRSASVAPKMPATRARRRAAAGPVKSFV